MAVQWQWREKLSKKFDKSNSNGTTSQTLITILNCNKTPVCHYDDRILWADGEKTSKDHDHEMANETHQPHWQRALICVANARDHWTISKSIFEHVWLLPCIRVHKPLLGEEQKITTTATATATATTMTTNKKNYQRHCLKMRRVCCVSIYSNTESNA